MNPVFPIIAGTLPVNGFVLLIVIRWNRAERRKTVVSKHIMEVLRQTLQRGIEQGKQPDLLRSKLVFERTGTAYRGRILN